MNKVLIALLAGVAVGVLIAPRKGSETRQKLIDGFDDLVGDLKEEVNAWKEEIQQDLASTDNITQPIV